MNDKQRRKELEAAAYVHLNRRIGAYATVAQVRAAAKKLVDVKIAEARRVQA